MPVGRMKLYFSNKDRLDVFGGISYKYSCKLWVCESCYDIIMKLLCDIIIKSFHRRKLYDGTQSI